MRQNNNKINEEQQQQKLNLKRKQKEVCSTNIVPKRNLNEKAFERESEEDENDENERFYEQLAREAEEVEIEVFI